MTIGAVPVIDSHLHLWNPERLSYPWLEETPPLRRPFGLTELATATEGVPLHGFIFVECNTAPEQALEEARIIREIADDEPRLLGIVAFADLTRPQELPAVLAAYRELGLVCGVRHNIQGMPRGFCHSEAFIAGVREVGRQGFTFDLCATHDQLDEVVRLAEACPDTPLILDHCGKPGIAAGKRDPWRAHIRELAQLPHLWGKLSGLLTEAGSDWSEDQLLPYAEHVVDEFGHERVMYGGDWPVLTLAGTYGEWYQFTRRFTSEWTPATRRAFYHDNALRCYGIEGKGKEL